MMEGDIENTWGPHPINVNTKWFTHWFFVYWICPNYDRKDSLTIKERPIISMVRRLMLFFHKLSHISISFTFDLVELLGFNKDR